MSRVEATAPEAPQSSPTGDRPTPELRTGVRRRPSTQDFRLRTSDLSGRVLADRYRVEGFLARGGTAEVFLARDVLDGQIVVIKQIAEAAASHPELRARFISEARVTQSIEHKAVVRVLGIEEPANDAPFMILEALRGESLGDYLRRNGTMPVELAVILLRQAAAALIATHDAGVIHRDVKPDNFFLVGQRDSPAALKLIDFGMAKLEHEPEAEDSTSVLGTAQYMAPEQILVEPVDARADVYGLGVVMFRLFTGHLPFEVPGSKELLLHQLFSPVPPPTWLIEDLDPRLESIILRATAKHPENRFASMRELLAALDAVVGLGPEIPTQALRHRPDVYHPATKRGRRVAAALAKDFGPYAIAAPCAD